LEFSFCANILLCPCISTYTVLFQSEQVSENCSPSDVTVVVAGTKSDLKVQCKEYHSASTLTESDLGVGKLDVAACMESASTGHGVRELLQKLVDACVEKKERSENAFMQAIKQKPGNRTETETGKGNGRGGTQTNDGKAKTSKNSENSNMVDDSERKKSKLCTVL
jgi:GTPase SAR1 family protein